MGENSEKAFFNADIRKSNADDRRYNSIRGYPRKSALQRNIKLTIEYDGTDYAGWQKQRLKVKGKRLKVRTIQETIEEALEKLLQEKVKLIASGRTDAGVHAKGQVANFKTSSLLKTNAIKRALNSILPEDVRIKEVSIVSPSFHSRFSAKSKLYRYTIIAHPYCPPFNRLYAHHISSKLDIAAMQSAGRYLLGCHNFNAFKTDSGLNNTKHTIKKLKITKDRSFIYIDIEADGFGYNMVRSIAGTLIDAGRGRFKPLDVKGILESQDRKNAGPVAPSHGLCLMEVRYG